MRWENRLTADPAMAGQMNMDRNKELSDANELSNR